MPKAHVNNIDLYYEIHGDGPNLTLIEGLGYHSWMWYRQTPVLVRHFRTLIYDNRGVGQSDKPAGPYTHRQNADDLAALLDHLGWQQSHVLGISMGGFIAQEFALAYGPRVDRLVLVATGFGGKNMVAVPPEAQRALMPDPDLSPKDKIRSAMPLAFSHPSWVHDHAEEFDQIIAWRLEHPQPAEATIAQAMAARTFDVESRLHEITAPTLVVAGTEDHVVPARNAELLAAALPNATLDLIPNAGHLVIIEAAERFNQDVVTFLQTGGDEGTR